MSTLLAPTTPTPVAPAPATPVAPPVATPVARPRHPALDLPHVGPNWYASVMGTGIVANAAASLPAALVGSVPGAHIALTVLARTTWVLAAALLVLVSAATLAHVRRHPAAARAHLHHPVMAHFTGAPAMALMTVGAGALLVGQPLVGSRAALVVAVTGWVSGTLLGLWTAATVHPRLRTRQQLRPERAFGGWLMPVVPPMVSAATGPALVPHLPAGPWRLAVVLACAALFVVALLLSLPVMVAVVRRLVRHGVGEAPMVPTWWIVLGPLGQSVTAAHTLGVAAVGVLPAPYGTLVQTAGVVYGAPVWGAALLWLALVLVLTVRTARRGGLPFTLTWWSFTFPVGTMVTGASGLAAATGSVVVGVAATTLFAGLVGAWATVASRTARGVRRGDLLRAPRVG